MKIAVLGVGLIGGSIGLAAKEHVADAEVVGFGRDRASGSSSRSSGARSTAPRTRSRRRVEGAELCFACAPVGALPELVRAALDAVGRGRARHRRGLDQAATS